jgi:hypothetical protein
MLTPEEQFLWECARTWRKTDIPLPSDGLDWSRVVKVGKANRMQTLLHTLLTRRNQLDVLPEEARTFLQTDVDKIANHATLLSDYLRPYLRSAAEQGMETVVLKGLSVSINIYGNAAMRPGGDIDILVRRNEVGRSLAIQEQMGVGPYWDNLMDDRYYERHHLHQQRCTPDLVVWFETHWALDHPLTLLTVDYDGILDRTTPGELLGEPVNDLSPPDLILCLALHLVKHALYLPSVITRPDLARIILADGMVMYFVDIAEAIKQYGEQMEWNLVVQLATEWGAVDTMGSVLRVCASLLDTPVPAWVLDALPVRGPGIVTRKAMQKVAEREVATHMGEPPNRFWDLMLITNGAFILRPIRLLEIGGYFFPGSDFLQRKYGSRSPITAARHLVRAFGQYARAGVDTLYFSVERYRRLKALKKSASLFNRLN